MIKRQIDIKRYEPKEGVVTLAHVFLDDDKIRFQGDENIIKELTTEPIMSYDLKREVTPKDGVAFLDALPINHRDPRRYAAIEVEPDQTLAE